MNELNRLTLQRPAWLEDGNNQNNVVLDTRVEISRNLEQYPFPHRASLLEKEQVYNSLSTALASSKIIGESPLHLNLQKSSDIAVTLLFERELIDFSLIQSSGDRGVILGDNGVTIAFNSHNHLMFFTSDHTKTTQEKWELLDSLDTRLGKDLSYAYDAAQGFLLSDIDSCGTGLSLSSTLHLPGLLLTNTLHQVLNGVAQAGIMAEGKFKDGNDSWGSLFRVRSGAYSGDTEEEILEVHHESLKEIELREREARQKLFDEAHLEMEDKIWRSLGILQNCRLLSIPQLLNLTSALRLGIEEGVLDNKLSLASLNSLIASSLQGSVALLTEEEVTQGSNLDKQRAEIIRTLLS